MLTNNLPLEGNFESIYSFVGCVCKNDFHFTPWKEVVEQIKKFRLKGNVQWHVNI